MLSFVAHRRCVAVALAAFHLLSVCPSTVAAEYFDDELVSMSGTDVATAIDGGIPTSTAVASATTGGSEAVSSSVPTSAPTATAAVDPPLPVESTLPPGEGPPGFVYVNTTATGNSTSAVTVFENSTTLTTVQVEDQTLFGGLSISIPVKVNPVADSGNASFTNSSSATNETSSSPSTDQTIKFALPQIFEQLEVPPEKVKALAAETAPILGEALMYMFGGSDVPDDAAADAPPTRRSTSARRHRLRKRGISIKGIRKAVGKAINDVSKPIKDVIKVIAQPTCAMQTQLSLSGFLAVWAQVLNDNPGPGVPVSRDHMFFLYPLYGSFPESANLRLHFSTRKFLGFIGAYDAITFGRDMFIVDSMTYYAPTARQSFAFESNMRTIIHEVQHTTQYRNVGFSVPAFGAKYVYQFCTAGFRYRSIAFEAEAFNQENRMNPLLANARGYTFFRYWKSRALFPALGYPTATNYAPQPGVPASECRHHLTFQKGVLRAQFFADGGACWTYRTTDELAAETRVKACSSAGRCEPAATVNDRALSRDRECLTLDHLR